MQWLRADLAQFRAPCTLAYWHHPLFTSGPNRNDPNDLATPPLWQALHDAGADVILNGHDHHYERFAPQDPLGNRDDEGGIREFVVGTGGKSLYNFERRSPRVVPQARPEAPSRRPRGPAASPLEASLVRGRDRPYG